LQTEGLAAAITLAFSVYTHHRLARFRISPNSAAGDQRLELLNAEREGRVCSVSVPGLRQAAISPV